MNRYQTSQRLRLSSGKIADLRREYEERAWAKKKGLPATKARDQFGRLMSGVITEKRNAASLARVRINLEDDKTTQTPFKH